MSRDIEVPERVVMGLLVAGLDVQDLATLAFGAAAWAAGLPLAQNENTVPFQETVNRVLDALGMHFDFTGFEGR